MKNLILMMAVMCVFSVASADEKAKPMDSKEHHMQMHEQMAKAHQQAADCLKSGKSEEECRSAFHATCKEATGSEKCGEGMMHEHGKHKKKSTSPAEPENK